MGQDQSFPCRRLYETDCHARFDPSRAPYASELRTSLTDYEVEILQRVVAGGYGTALRLSSIGAAQGARPVRERDAHDRSPDDSEIEAERLARAANPSEPRVPTL